MIQLLFILLLAKAASVAVLLFCTPLRKVALHGLDRLKRGHGPLVVGTVATTGLVALSSSLYSIDKIRSRSTEAGRALTPTDQVLLSRHLLEASLMGCSLFLAIVIDRLDHYFRKLRGVRKSIETVIKQNRVLEEAKSRILAEMIARYGIIAGLNEQIKQLKLASEENMKQAKKAEVNATAMTKQTQGLLLEYRRLLEENQNMRRQLRLIDRHLPRSHSKKNA